MNADEAKPKGTMGRSQYLLNRSKQRFKQRHHTDSGSNGGDESYFSESKSACASPTVSASASFSEQRSSSQHHHHYQQQQQYQDLNENYPLNNQQHPQDSMLFHSSSSMNRSYEEDYRQQRQLGGGDNHLVVGDGTLRQQEDLSLEEQQIQKQLERQRYEHQQQQMQLQKEQIRQQEQLRWQQKQLQLQQDQLRQQEQIRQTRQQQQIRNQKVHHQQRLQFHEKQKQLRDQQHMLDEEFQEKEEGLKQQMELQKQQQERLRQKELRRQQKREKRQQRDNGQVGNDLYIKVRKECWRQQQLQLLNQQKQDDGSDCEDDEGLQDLCKTMKNQSPSNRVRPTNATVAIAFHSDDSTSSSKHKRGVRLDVRTISEALEFLDRANRLQIPEHLASTLENVSPVPLPGLQGHQSKEHAMRRAIAVRKERKLQGSEYAALQNAYARSQSVSSGYSSMLYSRHTSYLPMNLNHDIHNPATFGNMIIPEPLPSVPARRGTRSDNLALSDSSSSSPGIEQSSTISTRKDMFEDSSMVRKDRHTVVDTSFLVDPNTQVRVPQREAKNSTKPKAVPESKHETPPSAKQTSSAPDYHIHQRKSSEKETVTAHAETPLHRNNSITDDWGDMRSPSPNVGLSPDAESSALVGSLVMDAGAEDFSFPSLRISEAICRGKSPHGAHRTSSSRNPSPSPSDVLMTYTVTENDDDSKSISSHSRRSKSGISSIKNQRSVSVRNRSRNHPPVHTKAEKIRIKVESYQSSSSTSDVRDGQPIADLPVRLPPPEDYVHDDTPILPPPSKSYSRSRSRSHSKASSGGSSRGNPRRPTRDDVLYDHPIEEEGPLSNDFGDTSFDDTTLPSRRSVDEYRSMDKADVSYNLSEALSDDFEDSRTSYSRILSDSLKDDDSSNPRQSNRRRRDPMSDYEDASNSIVDGTDEDDSTFARRSQFTETDHAYLADDNNYRSFTEKGADSFFSSDINSSRNNHYRHGRRQHQDALHPYQSFKTADSSSALSPPVRNGDRTKNGKGRKNATGKKSQRYVPVGIPARRGAESEGVGLLLFEGESSRIDNRDEDDLDHWLESAMASKSIDGDADAVGVNRSATVLNGRAGKQRGGDDEADLDEWLDNIIRR